MTVLLVAKPADDLSLPKNSKGTRRPPASYAPQRTPTPKRRRSTRSPHDDDSDNDNSHRAPISAADDATVRQLYLLFLCYYVTGGSYDMGAVTSTLPDVIDTFQVKDFTLLGLLGSIGYYGMVLTLPLFGVAFTRAAPRESGLFTAKNGLALCWLVLAFSALVPVALAQTFSALLAGKFMIGVCQSAADVYFPVWVEEWGPEDRRAQWLGTRYICIVLGVFLGYLSGGVFDLVFHWCDWREVYGFQGVCTVAAGLGLLRLAPARLMVIKQSFESGDDAGLEAREAVTGEDSASAGRGRLRSVEEGNKAIRSSSFWSFSPVASSASAAFISSPKDRLVAPLLANKVVVLPGSVGRESEAPPSDSEAEQDEIALTTCEAFRLLLTNYNYLGSTVALMLIFLFAQGVQFWSPTYMRIMFFPHDPDAEKNVVMANIVLIAML